MTGMNQARLDGIPRALPTTQAEWISFIMALEQAIARLPFDFPYVQILAESGPGGSTTTSATYVNWPTTGPLDGTIYKRYGDESNMLILFEGCAYMNIAGALATFGVNLVGIGGNSYASTDHGITRYFFNTAADHRQIVGAVLLGSLPAGPYTATLRASISGNTLTSDGNDDNRLIFIEVPKLSAVT